MDNRDLLEQVVGIARKAGEDIMEIYKSDDFAVETKTEDDRESPLTKADKAAHDIIERGLQRISDYPVVSEEGSHSLVESSKQKVARSGQDEAVRESERFWLVDPLDGTKEFIKKNGEFTVNIALIEGGKPVLGVVLAPDKKLLYAADSQGAYMIDASDQKTKITSEFSGNKPVVIVSRSHRDERIDKLLDTIGEHEEASMGSSLKLCLIAEGKAQIYPRFAPTYLWDTAAAHAIILIAGGRVRGLNGEELVYEPAKDMKNPFFVATAGNDRIFEDNRDILKDI